MPLPLPEMQPCHFCQIINGESDRWNVIHEDEQTLTVLNGRQFEVGQCMALTARHVPTLLDLTLTEAAAVMAAAQRLAAAMVSEFAPDGVLLALPLGARAGRDTRCTSPPWTRKSE